MKILYTTKYAPYPTRGGSSQRSLHLYRALAALGNVSMITLESPVAFTDDERRTLTSDFGLVGIGPVSAPGSAGLWAPLRALSPRLATQLAHNLDGSRSRFRPDARLITQLGMPSLLSDVDLVVGRYAPSLSRLGLLDGALPTVLDVDDLDSDIYRSRLAVLPERSVARRIVARHMRHIEQREPAVFDAVDRLWVANPDNREHPALERATVLPNIPYLPEGEHFNRAPVDPDNHEIMCIASFGHKPNIDGVQWFIESVWPQVRRQRPQAQFTVYGSSMSATLKRRWSACEGVTAAGFVDRIAPVYERSALCVCPVNTGAGTNIKVLEAAAHTRCCLLTPMAARGFSTDPALSPHLQICADAEVMASRIVALLDDPAQNNRIASAAQAAVAGHYSASAFTRIVHDTVATLLPT